MSIQLMTANEAAAAFNLPSPRTLRTMRQRGLPAAQLGKAFLYDRADIEAYIRNAKVTTCPAETPARGSNGSKSEGLGTSSGMRRDASVSVQLARQTAAKLKKRSPSTFANDEISSAPIGRVTPIR